ncbi:hypothetical protein RvY_04583 [Ramazzottius varieornatus]|uniref:Uncharacterized protein n=1 Tax=Ramazzottius varieornatus TaxID=947166 RepID=A0A1D1UXU3_RAMVA|nr:hypothetical protein RvY_04478 [Ramazzottius varieornatus]GAU92512.1 hypothetical protein RvY_04583 [Ramazzottius varieornatus]
MRDGTRKDMFDEDLPDRLLVGADDVLDDDPSGVLLAQDQEHHLDAGLVASIRIGHVKSSGTVTTPTAESEPE